MPLVDVTYDSSVSDGAVRELGEVLPALVAAALDCPEDPWVSPPGVGDIEIRFHPKGALDVGELNCVIEVRTKLFPSRVRDKQRRVDLLRDGIPSTIGLGALGIWLILAEGAWTQTLPNA